MESNRQRKVNRLIQKELSEIFNRNQENARSTYIGYERSNFTRFGIGTCSPERFPVGKEANLYKISTIM